jgi:hypothetical protein
MNTKEIKITVPEGYEIDKENSTFECIKFKKKKGLTYEDICPKVLGMRFYCIDTWGGIGPYSIHPENENYERVWYHPNNARTKEQLQRLLAINKLMNVAEYLNGDWKPDWKNPGKAKWYIDWNYYLNKFELDCRYSHKSEIAHFKTPDLATQAIEILGEEEVKLALGV